MRAIAHDAKQPRSKAIGITAAPQLLPTLEESVLNGVIRVGRISSGREGDEKRGPCIPLHQTLECRRVTAEGGANKSAVAGFGHVRSIQGS